VSGAGGPTPAPGPARAPRHFGDRLAAAVAARESQIVLGIDPDPARLWPAAVDRTGEARAVLATSLAEADAAALAVREPGGAETRIDRTRVTRALAPRVEAAAAVLGHCLALIEAAAPACVAAKPQLACFERLGSPGWLALENVCEHARAHGLLVLADGKRGDVPVSAVAYGQALVGGTPSPFGTVPGLGVDAFTANPLLGGDALEPLVRAARAAGAGPFVLVRTSNPGAADLLDLRLADGSPLWARLARLVADLGTPGASGLADVGAVTGATEPEHLERLRALMPAAPLLLPGIGAQGGDVAAVAPAFAPGRAGGLVTASRSIAHAHEDRDAEPAAAARAEAERLRERAWALG
jgi:orotidine-5'-phosphate decarboxylase